MSSVIMDEMSFFFWSKMHAQTNIKYVKLILACLVLSTCDWTVFLVILKRLSIIGHTVLPNWECGYISVCVFCLREIWEEMHGVEGECC